MPLTASSPVRFSILLSATYLSLISFGVPTRPDIIQDIKGQGLWGKLSAKSPEYVAKTSLKKVKKNKRIHIPGFFNKFLYHFMKFVPLGLKMRFIANRWKKQTKDAF